MFEVTIDRAMYDHPGKQTTMTFSIRRYRDLPALTKGETVAIVRMAFQTDRYGQYIAQSAHADLDARGLTKDEG